MVQSAAASTRKISHLISCKKSCALHSKTKYYTQNKNWSHSTLWRVDSCEHRVIPLNQWKGGENLSSHLFLNHQGHWGTTDDFATSFLHFSLFSTAFWDLANYRPVHSLMLSSHLFLCLPCLLLPFTEPCKMALARPDERETCPYHCSLRLFTMARRSSSGPIACWILGTDFLVGNMVFVWDV